MDILYFAFANHPDRPLEELKREDAEINRLLEPLAARGLFRIVRDSFATLDTVVDKLSLFKRNLVLFHYSGHAGPDSMELLDGSAQSKGIAALLGECSRLQLVMLNGCATQPQVDALHALKIPLVIATQRPVEDPKAAAFAIQFYRSLSLLDTIEGAFNTARGKTLTMDAQLDITRGLALPESLVDHIPAWGLFGLAGRADAAQWRLSKEAPATELDSYEPNTRLIESLLEALSPYRPEIAKIIQDEANGKRRSILDKREYILKALPHPISELLRYLLVSRSAGSNDIFYDKPGLGRLRQIQTVYFTVLELMAFIMMSQLWDVLVEKREIVIPEATQRLIQEFLLLEAAPSRFDYITLIGAIRELFDELSLPYFVEELEQLKLVVEGSKFSEANYFFNDLSSIIKKLGQREAELLCVDAEEHLARVLSHLGFVACYNFASVKNIDVLKYRHQATPSYRHSIVKLEQRFQGLEADSEFIDGPLDSSSVLLLKERDGEVLRFLNLTPFVIDQNAFDEKATVAKLHFFMRYIFEQDAYLFRHIYMAEDPPLLVSNQKHYDVLKGQFNAFARLLFQQPMNKLSA